MFIGQLVSTPYGEGEILSINENHCIIQPINWLLAQNQKPTFYINIKDVNPVYSINANVKCSFGTGIVVDIRESDGIYIVRLDNWKLADGKSPILYLNQSSVFKIDIQNLDGNNTTKNTTEYFNKHIADALKLKNEGTESFKANNIIEARLKYMSALETLQLVSGDLSNLQKSQLFEHTVTCNNNVALCCIRLKEYQQSIAFATNTLVLINSLEKNIPNGQIWKCLLQNNITLDKLQKEWKKKSYFYIGKSELSRQNYKEAIINLKAALNLIIDDKSLATNITELKQLIAEAKTKKNAENKKDHATWERAFKKNEVSEDEEKEQSLKKNIQFDPIDLKIDLNKLNKDNTTKQSKKDQKKSKNHSIWSSINFNNYSLFFGIGMIGLLGGFSYIWMKNRRNK